MAKLSYEFPGPVPPHGGAEPIDCLGFYVFETNAGVMFKHKQRRYMVDILRGEYPYIPRTHWDDSLDFVMLHATELTVPD